MRDMAQSLRWHFNPPMERPLGRYFQISSPLIFGGTVLPEHTYSISYLNIIHSHYHRFSTYVSLN